MPVFRVENYLDAYRLRAQSEDIHELAGRPDKKALTEFVNRQVLDAIQAGSDDFLVDIGCGDASLLRMATASKRTGIVSTVEEQQRLQSTFPGLFFIASTAQLLPADLGGASKVVCNGTLFLLPTENDVEAALREMARIACPGATIWVGEIPEIDEYDHYGMYRGTSMLGLLWHLLRRNGPRSFLGMIRRWLRAVIGKEQIILNSAGMYHAAPDKMIALAESCGLHIKTYFRHKELNQEGQIVNSPFRYDYVFTV
jgi:hypothetical protein